VGFRLLSSRFFIFLMIFIVPLGIVLPAHAAAVPSHRASCDEDFHDVMETRAWMLASREYETAQEFLEQGRDSVLLLTCHDYSFDDFEGNEIVAFEDAIDEYMVSNFPENCRTMNDVWTLSKCADFDKADFINFMAGEYQGPRSCPDPSDRTDAWDAAVAASQPAAATPAASGGMDAVVTYLERTSWLMSDDCGTVEPLDTGVKYKTSPSDASYKDEKVCVKPGCYYNGSSCE
jgi:hypothetical protein